MSEKISNEITTPILENNEVIKSFYERNKKVIENLLEETKNKLGEGATADVYFLDSNKEVCLKILKQVNDVPYHVPLEDEMDFLLQMHDDSNLGVRVPKSYLTADYEKGISFMLMERLNASSVRDILEGRGSLPENFSINEFRNKIALYIERMHEKNIYHRDLHEGNIMINATTGELYVIDFGASKKSGYGEEDVYKENRLGKTIMFPKDEESLKRVCDLLQGINIDK